MGSGTNRLRGEGDQLCFVCCLIDFSRSGPWLWLLDRGFFCGPCYFFGPWEEQVGARVVDDYHSPYLVAVVVVVFQASFVNFLCRLFHRFFVRVVGPTGACSAIFFKDQSGGVNAAKVFPWGVIDATSCGRAKFFYHRAASGIALCLRRYVVARAVIAERNSLASGKRARAGWSTSGSLQDFLIHLLGGLFTWSTLLEYRVGRFFVMGIGTRADDRFLSCFFSTTA